MPLFAAASINIDFAMFVGFVLIGLVILALAYLCKLARRAVRRACGNEIDINAPRVRTRIHQPPIETDIAQFLHREYPNRKPAQFI